MSSTGSREKVDEIKNRLDILTLIDHDVGLHHIGGSEYAGTVGSAGGRGESLKVDRNKQVWKDFKHGKGGDVLDWIGYNAGYMDYRGADFPEVLKIAADLAGVELAEMTEEEKGAVKEKADVHNLFTEAAEIYHKNLTPELYNFIKDKWGITPETVDRLSIGYATISRNLKDLDKTTLKKSGLVYVNGGMAGGEVFTGRIIFPYWKNGKVVYLIGRETEETPKRKDGKETSKYQKLLVHGDKYPYVSPSVQNSYFYGEDSLKSSDYCIITEGVADCIAMLQAGFPCISPVTVRFREQDHPKLISLTKGLNRVYVCNDNDANKAGIEGALSTAEALEGAGIEARLIELPKPEGVDKIDIADYMKDHSSKEFKELMLSASGLWDFKLSIAAIPEKPLDRFKAFEKFIKTDLAEMKSEEWDIFVMNEVRVRFDLKKGEVKGIVTENRPTPEIKTDAKNKGLHEIPPNFKRFYEVKINRDGETVIKLIYSEIAFYLTEKNNILSYAETLYIYKDGIYQSGEIELKAAAQAIIKALDFKGSITEATREIIHYLTYENPETNYPFNEYGNVIPVGNGLLKVDFDAGKVDLIDYTPEYKFNFKLPINYDPAADIETIDKVIRGYVDPEEREGDNGKGETIKLGYSDADLLYQIPAQALLQMTGAATFKKGFRCKKYLLRI